MALPSGVLPIVSAPPADFVLTGQFTQGGWLRGTAPKGATALPLDGKPLALAPDGTFFAAFDRDFGPSAELVAQRTGASDLRRVLTITPRQWQIERVNAPFHPSALPDADFARIRKDELARIGAARTQGSDSLGWQQSFGWPLKGPLRGRFGSQRIFRGTPGAYHPGLDIAGAQGAPFVAPADGVVTLAAAAPFTLEGNLLIVDHGMGLTSAFLHSSGLAVKVGDHVRQGQLLGWVGMTGRATGPHLHWALKWREARLDPLLFVAPVH
jgi:murein DD-endopeptidase MepM/ murein hydrolase activator NlpD